MRCNRVKRLLIFPYMTYRVLNIDLRSTIYGLRFTVCDLRYAIHESRLEAKPNGAKLITDHDSKKNP